MAFVLDGSLTMAWIFADESTERLRESLIEESAAVPALWPAEVGNVLLAATRCGRIHADDWPLLRASLETLPIEVDPLSAARVWGPALELAKVHGIFVHDAMYLEVAVRLRLPLATLDRALGTAGRAAGLDGPALAWPHALSGKRKTRPGIRGGGHDGAPLAASSALGGGRWGVFHSGHGRCGQLNPPPPTECSSNSSLPTPGDGRPEECPSEELPYASSE